MERNRGDRVPEPKRLGTIFALFHPSVPLNPIVEALRALKISDEAISICSGLPLADAPPAADKEARLYRITLTAGAVGIFFGILLAGGTAILYPLPTGGKPIVTTPVVGIISYETMMLFAIVSTFLATLIALAWGRGPKSRHDPRIGEGFIGVSVFILAGDPRSGSIQELLQRFGALEVQ